MKERETRRDERESDSYNGGDHFWNVGSLGNQIPIQFLPKGVRFDFLHPISTLVTAVEAQQKIN